MPCRATLLAALLLVGSVPAWATPLTKARTEKNVDWVSAGVGGLGAGSGVLTVSGVSGTITHAFLYWHGIDRPGEGGDGIYDNPEVSFAGTMVTGVAIGDGPTNCWPKVFNPPGTTPTPAPGSSRAYRADVTSLVTGNGSYAISGLAAKSGHDGNGASLVVIFDDGNPANDRDLIIFEGNDGNVADGFPGEADGWNDALEQIAYSGGAVFAELHVADGQGGTFTDDTVTFSTGGAPLSIMDTDQLWDGQSVPDAGHSRATDPTTAGSLWDIHTFDASSLFTGPGTFTLTIDGQFETVDCIALLLVLLDVQATQPTPTITPLPFTPTSTATRTSSATPTPTPSATATRTATASVTSAAAATSTRTASATSAASFTATRTTTAAGGTTSTATRTATASVTSAAPATATATRTASGAVTLTATRTVSGAVTATGTPTGPATGTITAGVVGTSSATQTPAAATATGTGAVAATETPGGPATPTGTVVLEATETPDARFTATASLDLTVTASPAVASTETATAGISPTATRTAAEAATVTPIPLSSATATHTATEVLTVTGTPTASGTAGTATPTANLDGSATTTPTAGFTPSAPPTNAIECLVPCTGDCNGDCRVVINELVLMVNIALSNRPVADCEAGDRNGDRQVTIEELVTAVNRALNGCPLDPAATRRPALDAHSEPDRCNAMFSDNLS